jgi:hypothetical protein
MLDPRVQQKGGFGAFADRERERNDARAAADAREAMDAVTGPVAAGRAADASALTSAPTSAPAAARPDVRRAEKTTARAGGVA